MSEMAQNCEQLDWYVDRKLTIKQGPAGLDALDGTFAALTAERLTRIAQWVATRMLDVTRPPANLNWLLPTWWAVWRAAERQLGADLARAAVRAAGEGHLMPPCVVAHPDSIGARLGLLDDASMYTWVGWADMWQGLWHYDAERAEWRALYGLVLCRVVSPAAIADLPGKPWEASK